ncbi:MULTISPECIES: hypothetical protein [Bacteria]|uniref:hypothetical protein n=1 Tax=Bacteria TaxID=2 RepID=UPI003F3D4B04
MNRVNKVTSCLNISKYLIIWQGKRDGVLEFKKIETKEEKEKYILELTTEQDLISYIIVKELRNNKNIKVDVIF